MTDSTAIQMASLLGIRLDQVDLSQAEFCRRVGTSQKHMSMVLNGRAVATPSTLDYWAWALGCHFEVRLKRGSVA